MKTKTIQTEIIIEAPAERVWQILTNLKAYSLWNPFIIKSEGEIKTQAKLKHVMLNGQKKFTFKPIVQRVEENHYFDWIGRLFFPGIFDGHHFFKIEKMNENQVKLVHGEEFSGLLSGFLFKKIGEQTRANFVRMNQAVKTLAEK